ncbi:Uncharacterised protein [Streptococcus pneumoniae]|nr:Uncharacterised protein [Streptococcus pneumoniae]CRG03215.1 Uncharacterised protein [Streptococcus pneumoniae]
MEVISFVTIVNNLPVPNESRLLLENVSIFANTSFRMSVAKLTAAFVEYIIHPSPPTKPSAAAPIIRSPIFIT